MLSNYSNSKLKNKKFNFELLTRCVDFYFLTFESQVRVTNVKLINEESSLNITFWMPVNRYKSILLFRFLQTSYSSMTWGCPGILKSGSGMDLVSNRLSKPACLWTWQGTIGRKYLLLFVGCITLFCVKLSVK